MMCCLVFVWVYKFVVFELLLFVDWGFVVFAFVCWWVVLFVCWLWFGWFSWVIV